MCPCNWICRWSYNGLGFLLANSSYHLGLGFRVYQVRSVDLSCSHLGFAQIRVIFLGSPYSNDFSKLEAPRLWKLPFSIASKYHGNMRGTVIRETDATLVQSKTLSPFLGLLVWHWFLDKFLPFGEL